jgi:hypothetical protein
MRHSDDTDSLPSEADAEMMSAAKYYESQQNPSSILILYQEIEAGASLSTMTFPFGVVFRIMPNQYVIIAVMHLHREPGYWKNRVP